MHACFYALAWLTLPIPAVARADDIPAAKVPADAPAGNLSPAKDEVKAPPIAEGDKQKDSHPSPAKNPEHQNAPPPPGLRSGDDNAALSAAQAELLQAQQMADQALAAAQAAQAAASSVPTASSSFNPGTTRKHNRIKKTHHSMDELANSAQNLDPGDSNHHTVGELY